LFHDGSARTGCSQLAVHDDIQPREQGSPTARIGFNYQDEIAVSFFLGMLSVASMLFLAKVSTLVDGRSGM
jgi:hypothetical protein